MVIIRQSRVVSETNMVIYRDSTTVTPSQSVTHSRLYTYHSYETISHHFPKNRGPIQSQPCQQIIKSYSHFGRTPNS